MSGTYKTSESNDSETVYSVKGAVATVTEVFEEGHFLKFCLVQDDNVVEGNDDVEFAEDDDFLVIDVERDDGEVSEDDNFVVLGNGEFGDDDEFLDIGDDLPVNQAKNESDEGR